MVKETERLEKDPVPGITAVPKPDNLRYFDVTVAGPDETPFAGGTFRLELFLPEGYPMEPPKVRFLTKIYHPNIVRVRGAVGDDGGLLRPQEWAANDVCAG